MSNFVWHLSVTLNIYMLTSYFQNNEHYSPNVHYFKFHFVLPQCLPLGNVIIWFILYHLVYSYFLNLEIFYTAHTHTHTSTWFHLYALPDHEEQWYFWEFYSPSFSWFISCYALITYICIFTSISN